ncbi:MAG: DUF1998 domain-containing protein, partial [Chloroflexi bacterium]|nr:DUF1998 domain-containing protein [Chloroflexota bacterium]
FLPKPFMLCLNCAEAYTRRDKGDFRKLSRLSSEGRSTATTLLSLSTVASLRAAGIEPDAQKVLSFTDNRQDASLQAGHLNDFVQVALIRSAIYKALQEQGELDFSHVADAVVQALALPTAEYARQANLEEDSPQAREARNAFHDLIEYRVYEDLRRGWRVVQPNLEQCGLLTMDYRGLRELSAREDLWESVPFLGAIAPTERQETLRVVLDEMRRQLAIQVRCLERDEQDPLARRVDDYLNEFWAFGGDRLRYAARYVLPGTERLPGDYSLSTRSVIGRWLQTQWRQTPDEEASASLYEELINGLAQAMLRFGLWEEVTRRRGRSESIGYRIPASALLWRLGEGRPVSSPLRRRQATGDVYTTVEEEPNAYFQDLYAKGAQDLRRARGGEHTAQVGYEMREKREKEFREGDLSCLFCSPTMELGIDIADLNAVHLRNVPPTPANYAQRSGRAGRAGQPALVLAYCSNWSGHDQYYFRRRADMVAGSVVPPRLDLANEDLIRAHVQAIWLSFTRVDLGGSVPDTLDISTEGCPLLPEVEEQLILSPSRDADCLAACRRVLEACGEELTQAEWYTGDWLEQTLSAAPTRFDRAFDRWRELFRLAMAQWEEAQRLKRASFTRRRGQTPEGELNPDLMEREARRQRDLLFCENTRSDEGDFYPYRYLASEGFLPGYNFPALPVRAYLARGSEGEFISRPRLLAVTEFGPVNVIYHEGSKFAVNRVFLPTQDPEARFRRAKYCKACGYIHADETLDVERCQYCGADLQNDTGEFIGSLLEMPTVGTQRRERITCDEEERRREGYHTTTHFQFAPAPGGRLQRRPAQALGDEGAVLLDLTYAPQATLWRINHRWRRSREDGYTLDLSRGRWLSQEEAQKAPQGSYQPGVRLYVRHTANAMLVNIPSATGEPVDEAVLASLQFALARGIQQEFQVEEGELSVERLGEEGSQRLLFWEAAEGGLGVLRRLVAEPDALARVARRALDILHFEPDSGDDRYPPATSDTCTKACYDCLLSYRNQWDHPRLDRHLVRDLLLALSSATTRVGLEGRDREAQYRWLSERLDRRSDLERLFLDALYASGRRLPDDAQRPIPEVGCTPDFFLEPEVCVFCDGSVHDEPQQRAEDERQRRALRAAGYRVVTIRYDRDLEAQLREHEDIWGEATA